MRQYFNSEAEAEASFLPQPGVLGVLKGFGPAFYGKILHIGYVKWMTDSDRNSYARASFYVLEDLTHTIPQIVQRSAGVQGDTEVRQPETTAVTRRSDKRVEVMAEIRRRKDRDQVRWLIESLRDGDSRVREEAASTLESLGDASAVEPLIAALRDLDGNVRLKVVRALGVLKDPKAVDPLIVHLHDPDNIVRVFAAYALARLADKRAVDALRAALAETTHEEARQAMQSAIADLAGVTTTCPPTSPAGSQTNPPQLPQSGPPPPSAKKPWWRFGGIATLFLVIGVGLWWGLSFQSRRAAIQRVMTEWKAIDGECWPQLLEGRRPKTPEAAAQQEALLTRYFGKAKQIDLSACPPEFSTAFTEYVAAKERHDRALHGPPPAAGRELQNLIVDIPGAAKEMYEAYDRLEAAAKKYLVQVRAVSPDEVVVGPRKEGDRPGAAEAPDPETEVYTKHLALSRCYQGSNGSMSCATCHEPGRLLQPTEVITYYRGRCLSCHRQESCTIPLAERQRVTQGDDCRSCHMPAAPSAKDETLKQTDHRLLRKP